MIWLIICLIMVIIAAIGCWLCFRDSYYGLSTLFALYGGTWLVDTFDAIRYLIN